MAATSYAPRGLGFLVRYFRRSSRILGAPPTVHAAPAGVRPSGPVTLDDLTALITTAHSQEGPQ